MAVRRSRITGIGSYVPDRVVTNAELSELMDTSDEWIVQRTGIRERRWVEGATSTSDLALEASKRAIADGGADIGDVDMLVAATLSPDHDFPGLGCFLQAKLGLPGIPAIDVRQQCSGFLYSLSIADQYIRTGEVDRVLVVGAEIHSKGIDVSDRGRDVAVLFGDGAGAVLLEGTEVEDPAADPHVLSTHLYADGAHAKELWLQAPGQAYAGERITPEILERGEHYPQMNGRAVFMNAVKRMPEAIGIALERNGLQLDDVDLFVLHQANLRINEFVAKNLRVPEERVFNTIERFGNTTAATIPIGLDEARRAGALQPGMLVAFAAFGAGFTWASALVRV
jgi:3-oxoacyl-[acyl-carrier-protein] synthase III